MPVSSLGGGFRPGLHSLVLVNRAVCWARLIARACRRWRGCVAGPNGGPVQVHVRHRWPPRLEPPAHGQLGADAALGIRQPAQGLAADAPPAWTRSGPIAARPRLLPPRPASRPSASTSCRWASIPEVFRPGLEPLPLPPGPERPVPVRRRDDLPQGDRRAADAFARAFRPPTASAW